MARATLRFIRGEYNPRHLSRSVFLADGRITAAPFWRLPEAWVGFVAVAAARVPAPARVGVSVIASRVGYLARPDAFARILAPDGVPAIVERRQGVVAALLFHLSPPMLLYGPLALSDAPALCFLALALAAGARLLTGGLGAAVALGVFAAGAVGCRPQLAVAVAPMVAAALLVSFVKRRRERAAVA